jgi:hypothetical protein
MRKMKRNKKYEALGFVEAMLAIMIVGVSSVVLMQIAVNTVQGIIQNEKIDEMTQHAIEAGEIVQELANRDKLVEEDIFPEPSEYGGFDNCFVLDFVEGNFQFRKDEEEHFIKFELENREDYKDLKEREEDEDPSIDDEIFRIICLQSPVGRSEEDLSFVTANIIVGQRISDGSITKGNLVKDYEYRTVIKLLGGNTEYNVNPPDPVCDDGVCSPGEDQESCPEDCLGSCGDDYCNPVSETLETCPQDCSVCGDGVCTREDVGGDEDQGNCPVDCIDDGFCYDFFCTNMEEGIERPCSSNEDCLAYCTDDNYCSNDEGKYCTDDSDCVPD